MSLMTSRLSSREETRLFKEPSPPPPFHLFLRKLQPSGYSTPEHRLQQTSTSTSTSYKPWEPIHISKSFYLSSIQPSIFLSLPLYLSTSTSTSLPPLLVGHHID